MPSKNEAFKTLQATEPRLSRLSMYFCRGIQESSRLRSRESVAFTDLYTNTPRIKWEKYPNILQKSTELSTINCDANLP